MEVVDRNISEKRLKLVQNGILKGMDYAIYRDLISELAKNRQTTGEEQLESLINYFVD